MTPQKQEYRKIPLSKGLFAIVDADDFDWLMRWKWCASWRRKRNIFYAVRHEKRGAKYVTILMHRQVMGLDVGRHPQVDHVKKEETLLNTKANLRASTQSQNMCNRGRQKNNTSGYKGVCWHVQIERWVANIAYNGTHYYLGTFSTALAAHLEYCKKAEELHEEFARTK